MLPRLPAQMGSLYPGLHAYQSKRVRAQAARHLRALRLGHLPRYVQAPCGCGHAGCVQVNAPGLTWAVSSPWAAATYYALARWGYTNCTA